MLSYQANGIGAAVEAIESDVPVVVLRHEIVPDTAGAGDNRGGASCCATRSGSQPAQHHLMSLRYKRPTGFGVNGGGDGTTGGDLDSRDDHGEETRRSPAMDRRRRTSYPYRRAVLGDAGRGAHAALRHQRRRRLGRPLERDPERVKRDVRDGYVTIEGAARDYGVVVTGDPDRGSGGPVVDLEATERLRSTR